MNARATAGYTPLHMAAGGGRDGAIAALLARGANLRAATDVRATPLHWAAHHRHAAAFMTLLNAGAELRAADAEGETPMSLATARGDVESPKQLQTWVRAELERRRADGGGRDEL